MLIDTHTHLYDSKYTDLDDVVGKAIDAGVTRMYMPNCNSETIEPMLQLAEKYPDHCFPMMGLHPCYVKENFREELEVVSEWLKRRTFAAIGEVGLDFYWDRNWDKEQEEALIQQMNWAKEYSLPIVVHSRSSTSRCIELIREYGGGEVRGVFHCFSGTPQEAQSIIDLGFYLGIGGVLSFKNASLAELLVNVDIDHLLLETDAPYLAPHPYRGKTNYSHYLPLICQKLAEVKQLSFEEVGNRTRVNAENLFRI